MQPLSPTKRVAGGSNVVKARLGKIIGKANNFGQASYEEIGPSEPLVSRFNFRLLGCVMHCYCQRLALWDQGKRSENF